LAAEQVEPDGRWAASFYNGPIPRQLAIRHPSLTFDTDLMEKLIIIGSGPAGWTAAIYAARAELQPLLFEGANYRRKPPQWHDALGQLHLIPKWRIIPDSPPAI